MVYLVSDQQVVGEGFAVKVLKEALDSEVLQHRFWPASSQTGSS